MTLDRWEKISSEDKFKNPWWTYRLDKYRLPNGKEGEYHYMHTGGCCFIITITDEGKILLTKQYRYLTDHDSVEFPAGGMNQDGSDSPRVVARKELIEETGFEGDLEMVAKINSYDGLSDEVMHVFIARNLRESDDYKSDETEEFEYLEVKPVELDQMIQDGKVLDSMSIAAWTVAKHKI